MKEKLTVKFVRDNKLPTPPNKKWDDSERNINFGWGETWEEFLSATHKKYHKHAEALYELITSEQVWHGGNWHQHEQNTPLFSDGKYATFGYRGWGAMMAACWSRYSGNQYEYMDFYMDETLPTDEPPKPKAVSR